jgi:hypothetical protein
MICERQARKYCCEDISLIENYKEAIKSDEMWDCHHRLEIQDNKYISVKELKDSNRYYNVEAKYLIFLSENEHRSLHAKLCVGEKNSMYGKHQTKEAKQKISKGCKGEKNGMYDVHRYGKDNPMYGKSKKLYMWKLPTGEIKFMDMANAHKYHPDWIKIGEV